MQEQPDILSVATRTPGRPDIVAFAAKNGVRALHVEKPIANNLRDCDAALGAVRAASAHITYGTTRRFMSAYREAKHLIDAGEIGTIEEIAVDHGRAPMLWSHPHAADLLLYFAGTTEIEFVQGYCTIAAGAAGGSIVDDDPVLNHGYVRFDTGIDGLITSGGGMHTRISGTRGVLTVLSNGRSIEVQKNHGPPRGYYLDRVSIAPYVKRSGTVEAFTELYNAVVHGQPPSVRPEEIRAGLNLLLGIVRSTLERGRRTRLDEVEPEFTVTGRTQGLPAA